MNFISFEFFNQLMSFGVNSFFDIPLPEDISTNGHLIDSLFDYTTTLNVFYFVLVCIGIFGFSYLYSRKRHPKPYYTYGNKKNHLIITGIIGAAVFLSIDLNITRMSNDDLIKTFWNFPKDEENPIKVQVLAQQWMWNFRYAGADGVFNTADDVLTNHNLTIPVGRKVEFRVTSKDVIHSLYFPNARLKVDAIPGRITRMWFEATKPGVYDIACAEMCGTHHYLMKAQLTVLSQEDYDKWTNEAQQIAKNGNDIENLDNYWGWKWENN
jgi:cytochrome c oxidase subunit 2